MKSLANIAAIGTGILFVTAADGTPLYVQLGLFVAALCFAYAAWSLNDSSNNN
jgi:hypothetical protein